MKRYILMALAALALASCYKDKAITPSAVTGTVSKFTFPDPATRADVQVIFDQIYKDYGVKVIWKDFTEGDLRRGWLSPGGTTGSGSNTGISWTPITDQDKLLQAARILQTKVFGLLPVSDKVKLSLQGVQYLYLTDNMVRKNATATNDVLPMYPTAALDGLGVNLQLSAADGDYKYKVFYPAVIAAHLFDIAYANGAFTVSDEFLGMTTTGKNPIASYSYAYNTSVSANTNYTPADYWANRGRIPSVSPSFGYLEIGKHGYYSPTTHSPAFITRSTALDVPRAFLYMSIDPNWDCAWFNEEQGEQEPPIGHSLKGIYTGTLLSQRLKLFNDEIGTQGINFADIHTALYEGSGVDTGYGDTRVLVRPSGTSMTDAKAFGYIYFDFNNN